MFKIIMGEKTLGVTENPIYIRRHKNNSFVLCPASEATGIVYNGTVYHLFGRKMIDGADTVLLKEIDAGTSFMDTQGSIDDLVVFALESDCVLKTIQEAIDDLVVISLEENHV